MTAQYIATITLVVDDYDKALAFYLDKLGFELVEDTPIPAGNKRWVVVKPQGPGPCRLLLAEATSPEQLQAMGNQCGGRVSFFLHTDDIQRDIERYQRAGVQFVREMTAQPYGKVAVFSDLYGNQWDLIEPASKG